MVAHQKVSQFQSREGLSEEGQALEQAFLGVTRSARGFLWRERLTGDARAQAVAMSQRHRLPELLGRVLAARGVAIDDVPVFLDPTLKALMPDPSDLQDMQAAATTIADAIVNGEEIAIFGDYDVDGASSAALLERFFRHHGVASRVYIPDRLAEGYGPNGPAMEQLVKDGARLVVTVDCGTMSHEPLAVATDLGAKVVVIDHHQADEKLPDVDAVVNPNRQDDLSGQGHLCAAGVVFLVLVAVLRELRARNFYVEDREAPDLLKELDLVALATVCDVVPLVGLNRAYVTKGLQVMRARRNRGIRALFDVAGLSQTPTPYHLGFILGPRINAGGRIGESGLGAQLLSSSDPADVQRIAKILDKLNRDRKAIEAQTLEEATALAEQRIEADPDLPIVILGSHDWHKGVVGLVASRICDRFHRPACVISWTKDASSEKSEGTGSLRSVNGVDIGAAVRAAVADGLLIKGGGHAMAAGLTVAHDKLKDVETYFSERLRSDAGAARTGAALELDGALTPSGAREALINLLERAGPYGEGNPQPRFAFPSHRVAFVKVVGDAHVRCALEAGDGSRIDAIAFRAVGQPLGDLLMGSRGMPLHVCGNLRRDTWGGRNRIELMIDDAADPRRQD